MNSASSSCLELPREADLPPRGEAPEFAELYRGYFGFAWASLRRLGVPSAAIDDAAQDLWVIVHRRLDTYDPDASLKAWLFGIARRVASHYRRSEQRNRRKIAALTVADRRRSDRPMHRRELALTVETFLAKLDERKRVAFVLSELEGWSAPEIAKVAGTNANTIYSRIRLAKEQLREQLVQDAANVGPEEAVETVKASTEAPSGAAKRCWMLLAPKLATESATAVGLGLTIAKFKFFAIGAAAGIAGLLVADRVLPAPAPNDSRPVAVATSSSADPETDGQPKPVAPTPSPAPVEAPSTEVPEAPLVQRPKSDPPKRGSVASTAVPEDPETSIDANSLAIETKLLQQAKRALAAGDDDKALAIAREHGRTYPKSSLADLRTILEVQALCSRDPAAARAIGESFAKSHPASGAATKVRAACADPGA